MRHAHFRLDDMSQQRVTANLLGSIDNFSRDPLPLLFQSGYLTISSYDPHFTMMGFYTEVERHTTDGRMEMSEP